MPDAVANRKSIPGITYSAEPVDSNSNKITAVVDSPNAMYQLQFSKGEEYFGNMESYNKFIKGCESLVRASDRYAAYKNHLMKDEGFDHCQVAKNISAEDATIEMHHGPIFTLFDICQIMIEWFLLKGKRITTFTIADAVLTEHEENRVQVVFLSQSFHEEVHKRNIFINMKQAKGNLNAFINKYKDAFPRELKEKYNRYFDRSMMSDSDDFNVLAVNPKLWTP